MSGKQDDVHQVFAERPEPTVALNPLTGLRLEDLMAATGTVALQGARQPLVLSKHLANYGRKLVDVLANNAEYSPRQDDRRFTDKAWQENSVYQHLLQYYLAMNETLEECVQDLDLDDTDNLRAEFLLRLIGDSLAPTNTLLGNPLALRRAWKTRGMSLFKGARNLVDDMRNNHGIPSQVKGGCFKVGENLATTPGAVVFSNEVLELIQYTPKAKQVFKRPLLMIGAMINKFYALDMTPDRSMIQFCLDQGLQVFVVSWANPGKEQADWGVESYASAVLEAITAIKSITRSKDLNVYSLCSGAMTASAMAAYLKANSNDSIHSLTVAVCMLDMQKTDMEVSGFVTDDMRTKATKRSRKAGIMPGYKLARSMLLLRPNDLIWSNVINNYLLGEDPPEFDLLFWNNDWTNLPAQLHADFIDMYATSALMHPGEMMMADAALDLQTLNYDKFFVGGTTDHITPWRACYRAMLAYGGAKEFVLSNSGHIQTLLNSPSKKNASFYTNKDLPENADQWREDAELQQGSWWLYWWDWIESRSGQRKNAPKVLGSKTYPEGTPAPGNYVLQQSEAK